MMGGKIVLTPVSVRRLPTLWQWRHASGFSNGADFQETQKPLKENQLTSVRLSKWLSEYSLNLQVSRREAERMIQSGQVRLAGQIVTTPHLLLTWDDVCDGALVAKGKALRVKQQQQQQQSNSEKEGEEALKGTRVWVVNKLSGEIVADYDPQDRPLLMERLKRGGVGRSSKGSSSSPALQGPQHLKAIGRLDMNTEGLILVTNDGKYAREMELPANHLHRTYRVRVHGLLTQHKLGLIQRGKVQVDGVRYGPMQVQVEASEGRIRGKLKTTGRNQWLRITCTEGKNRQVRSVLQHLGLTVSRLIRISFGDYRLQTIPAGMAVEVPVKPIASQRNRGALELPKPGTTGSSSRQRNMKNDESSHTNETIIPVRWIKHTN